MSGFGDDGSSDVPIGEEIGGYVVDGELGSGTMGIVYSASHPVIGKRAAIKVLRHEISRSPAAVERFVMEARAVNQIGHPNIVNIFGFGTLPDGRSYYVMDLLVGESLHQRIRRGGPLHVGEAASIIDEITSALMVAHDKGIIHRDLKPENVFLTAVPDRWPKVSILDWGLLKLASAQSSVYRRKHSTVAGSLLGTPVYMSPEQARGADKVDARTDVYSLGVIAYEMLAGTAPFGENTSIGTILAHQDEAVPSLAKKRPSLPPELVQLIEAMLAKDVDGRPTLAAVRAVIKRLKASKIPMTTAAGLQLPGGGLGAKPEAPEAPAKTEPKRQKPSTLAGHKQPPSAQSPTPQPFVARAQTPPPQAQPSQPVAQKTLLAQAPLPQMPRTQPAPAPRAAAPQKSAAATPPPAQTPAQVTPAPVAPAKGASPPPSQASVLQALVTKAASSTAPKVAASPAGPPPQEPGVRARPPLTPVSQAQANTPVPPAADQLPPAPWTPASKSPAAQAPAPWTPAPKPGTLHTPIVKTLRTSAAGPQSAGSPPASLTPASSTASSQAPASSTPVKTLRTAAAPQAPAPPAQAPAPQSPAAPVAAYSASPFAAPPPASTAPTAPRAMPFAPPQASQPGATQPNPYAALPHGSQPGAFNAPYGDAPSPFAAPPLAQPQSAQPHTTQAPPDATSTNPNLPYAPPNAVTQAWNVADYGEAGVDPDTIGAQPRPRRSPMIIGLLVAVIVVLVITVIVLAMR